MSVYYHQFEVRWSDIDANRHLANSSYMQYCAQTRMAFLKENKMGLAQLNRWGIGPVVLHESFSFFKEIHADSKIWVSLEVSGASEDGSIYEFSHKFYAEDGTHCATATAVGVWIDMMLRKSTNPPDEVVLTLNEYKSENTRLMSRDDIKALPFRPQNIDPANFK